MKKILMLAIVSMAIVGCGSAERNQKIINEA